MHNDPNASGAAQQPPVIVHVHAPKHPKRKGQLGLVLLLVFLVSAWCFGGLVARKQALNNMHSDYLACKLAREHPIISRLVAPEAAVRAAEKFAANYEGLERSNVFTALLHYFEVRAAHRELAEALGGNQGSEQPAQPQPTLRITSVEPGSNAASAGLRVGDVIVSYSGERITSGESLRRQIRAADLYNWGPTSITILRDGVQHTISVKRGTLGITLSDD